MKIAAKLFFVFLICFSLVFSFSSCKKKNDNKDNSSNDSVSIQNKDSDGSSDGGITNPDSGNVITKTDDYGGTITSTEENPPIEFKPEIIDDIFGDSE